MDDTAQTQPVQQPADQSAATPTTPVAPPVKAQMPVGVSPRPESGPMATATVADVDSDEQAVVRQEAPVIQQAHPEVVMPKEVADAGVTAGKDASADQLPEEKMQVEPLVPTEPTTASATDVATLPMSYQQALQQKKKVRSAKSGLSWIIREVIRQWKKKLEPEE